MVNDQEPDRFRGNMNLETSQIAWKELQRFFACGRAIAVSSELDLVDVADQFAKDNKVMVEQWMQEDRVGKVTDQQALDWFETDALVWAVVVKPWLLVQDVKS